MPRKVVAPIPRGEQLSSQGRAATPHRTASNPNTCHTVEIPSTLSKTLPMVIWKRDWPIQRQLAMLSTRNSLAAPSEANEVHENRLFLRAGHHQGSFPVLFQASAPGRRPPPEESPAAGGERFFLVLEQATQLALIGCFFRFLQPTTEASTAAKWSQTSPRRSCSTLNSSYSLC